MSNSQGNQVKGDTKIPITISKANRANNQVTAMIRSDGDQGESSQDRINMALATKLVLLIVFSA